ncbi:hypothetical protein [Streptomyces microflavus]|uniref:Uncharacterized protein n=1 Tax=Streptomyces microflavus TaxID=1919 RepID=A0ABV1QBG9_STRMI
MSTAADITPLVIGTSREDLSGFRDEYWQALEDIIAAKADGKPLPSTDEGEEKEAGEVVDLMAALNASVKAAKESRGEDHDGQDATVHERRQAAAQFGDVAGAGCGQGAVGVVPLLLVSDQVGGEEMADDGQERTGLQGRGLVGVRIDDGRVSHRV